MYAVQARRLSAAALALATALAAGGCSSAKPPAATSTPSKAMGDAHTANVTITAANGCTIDRKSFEAGALTVKVANQDATAVSEVEILGGERIVGEKENLPPGFSGSFAVNVDAGSYSLYCPGAANDKTPLTVTGTAAKTNSSSIEALFAQGTKQYAEYINTQVGYLVDTTKILSAALAGKELTAAQTAYKKARPYYERIEPVAESFTTGKNDLDAAIDAREGDVPLAKLTGFHKIEKGLFQAKSLDGLAVVGKGLVTDVQKLQQLTKGLTYKPYELANGAQELLDEVASSKVTGEEERYSRIDLLDFQSNDEGAEQAFANLKPALVKIDPTLANTISARFEALDTLVDTYRSTTDPSGFVLYTALTVKDKKALVAAVKAVQEPLSRVASKVAH
jgi:iron uptake system component EfeO